MGDTWQQPKLTAPVSLRTAVRAGEPGSDHGLPEDASKLGTVYHSTPYAHGFPYDEWMHVGTRAAAEDRARQINPQDYGLARDVPTTMHAVRLRGRVYPRLLDDEQATYLTGSGYPVRDIDDGLPSGEGYHVFPYHNSGEDAGSVSYVVHRSAIVPVSREMIPRTASIWQPASGIFGPTTGLDADLFDESGRLRPGVAEAVMTKLDICIRTDSGLAGSDWQEWTRVYLLGGAVSEWAGERPNGTARDLDVIVAINLRAAQGYNSFEGMSPGEAASALNAAFHRRFNDDHWRPSFGGVWALTAFCNMRAWDINAIRPYAAYDLTHGRWAVKPPHLPGHTLADFSPAVLAQARAVAAEARAILRMPEPLRTREATALWERLHAGRSTAFSEQGTGWDDPGNVTEKWLAYAPRHVLDQIRDLAHAPRTAAAEGYLRNPYHGTPEFGGRPEWSHTWFHGTRGEPDFGTRRKYSDEAQRAALPPEQRVMNSGWTQPNQHLGVHFSPLHEVGHKFAPSTWSGPTSIAHVRLKGSNPAHFETEEHLNIAMANWASQHYPHWHDDKLNANAGWNYGDQEGTHRDFSQVPDDPGQRRRMSERAQSLLQFHPHMPEILAGFKAHLRGSGHHGITYGNGVEGPYDTDATRGGDASMKAIMKHENWPRGAPKSFSAIADPQDIEVTHVEHIAPWRKEPEEGQRTWEDVSDSDEPDEMRDKVLDWHRQHHGRLPSRLGAREEQLAGMDPRTRATALAQEQVRMYHPLLTRPLEARNGQSSEVLSSWLRDAGHPGAEHAYVAAHPNPGNMQSNTGRGPDGEPVVVLHPDRWDYGTAAHEAAHLITDHQTGRAFGEPHGPEGAHSPQWARNYAGLLNRVSPGAAGHFMSLYRQYNPQGHQQEQAERAAEWRHAQEPQQAPSPGLVYLSVPHGTLHALPEGLEPRQVTGTGTHHVTVAHLPRTMTDAEHQEVLRHAAKAAAASPPLEGTLGGMQTFPRNAGPEGRRVAFVPASVPGIERLHADLSGVNASPHQEFHPHVTVAYLRKGQETPGPHPEVPVRFTHLHVEHGGKVTSFPLTGAPMQREAATGAGAWYHGTSLKMRRGDLIRPSAETGRESFYGDLGEEGEVQAHTHATHDLGNAADYARTDAIMREEGGRPYVYEVSPLGPVEPDPIDGQSVRSRHHMRVERIVPGHEWRPAYDTYMNTVSETKADFARERKEALRAEAVSGYDGLTKRTGMIYLDLPPGTVRPVPGGVDDHHVTLVYLGADVSDEAFAEACRRAQAAAAQCPPMDGVLRGIDIFPPSKSSDGKVPAFVPVYIGGVGRLRRLLEDLSASEHKDWRPHVTLAYLTEGDSLPAPHPAVPLRFTRVYVKRGADIRSFPLSGGLSPREASSGFTGKNGITYRLEHDTIENRPEPLSAHRLRAFAPGEDGEAGSLLWSGVSGEIGDLDISEDHRRQGLATALYRAGQDYDPPPRHSPHRTEPGDLWARSLGEKLPRRQKW